jgi:hypothetical protein
MGMTTVTDKLGVVGDEALRLQRRLRVMTTMVVIFAVALIGLAAWVIRHDLGQSDTAVTGEIETLLDQYTTAWNEYDGEAFLALVTGSYVQEYAGSITSAQDVAAAIVANEASHLQVQRIGEPIMYGDGPNHYVAQANRLTYESNELDGISLFTIVEQNGVNLISRHLFIASNE